MHALEAQQGIRRRITAEEFTNAYRVADASEGLDRFRGGVERIDHLLIDDAHLFLRQKLALGEFLHMCRQFQRYGKLMVVAGRRSPADFQVSEAITNMLSGAVVCEIEPPEPEAKVETIQSRLKAEGLGELPGDIARYLANAADYTIAQLIGVARNVLLRCAVTKEAPTVQLAKQLLSQCTKLTNFDGILLCVCRHFKIKNTAILLENRDKRYSRGRELVAYLAAEAGIPKRQIATRLQISPSKLCRMVAQLDEAAQTDAALGDLVLRLADEIDS
jgi:chromosomal replication initiation ATPase DnaA